MLAIIWTLLRWVWHAIKRGPTRHLVARVEVSCSCGKKFEVSGCKKKGVGARRRAWVQEEGREMSRMPRRIQRKRTRGWRMPPGAKYVGRGSFWGNPFRGSKALRLYRLLWRRRWKDLEREGIRYGMASLNLVCLLFAWERRLPELRDLDLVCWCPLERPCHVDILLKRANA